MHIYIREFGTTKIYAQYFNEIQTSAVYAIWNEMKDKPEYTLEVVLRCYVHSSRLCKITAK
jgi:hypothetical protein